jgi:hypothetical protein
VLKKASATALFFFAYFFSHRPWFKCDTNAPGGFVYGGGGYAGRLETEVTATLGKLRVPSGVVVPALVTINRLYG